MSRIASKHKKAIDRISYVAIFVGFFGMIFIIILLLQTLIKILTTKAAPPAVAPLIPGFEIGGIYLPFFAGILSIFIAVVAHEFAHGITAISKGLKIKSSGFGMFAIFPIAFVEPDEKELTKKNAKIQNSVFAMGPFANLILGILSLLILFFILSPAINMMITHTGVTYLNVSENGPAALAGMSPNMTITKIDNNTITTYESFVNTLEAYSPNQTANITANNITFRVTFSENPQKPGKAYLGILGVSEKYEISHSKYNIPFAVLSWLIELFFWLYVVNLGLGLMNLYPIFITDGARMLLSLSLLKKKYEKAILLINKFCTLILILHLLYFFLRAFGFMGFNFT